MVKIYTDGACEPVNPGGIATYGFVVEKEGFQIYSEGGVLREVSTNNAAEYFAIIKAMKWLRDNLPTEEKYDFFTDSKLLAAQISGEFQVKSKSLNGLLHEFGVLLGGLKEACLAKGISADVTVSWIPREENTAADAKTVEAYEKFCKENPEEMEKYSSGAPQRFRAPNSRVERHNGSGDSITPKQRFFLEKQKVPISSDMTKAQASRLISDIIAKFKNKKK